MSRYGWARPGDTNAFFGLMLDNVAVMITLVAIITAGGFSTEFVLTRMIPGTALGVLIGDLIYTAMAFGLARRTGRDDVCAMPLGLDTPSTFGMAFLVLLPTLAYAKSKLGMDAESAQLFAWHVAMLALILSGVFKLIFAPFGNLLRKFVPRAGLLGSLAGIALTLIAFLPLVLDGIAGIPLIGLGALIVILITLIAHRRLPLEMPGALAAILLGVILYQAFYWLGEWGGLNLVKPMEKFPERIALWDPASLATFYTASGDWWGKVWTAVLEKLPVVLPFALATIVGGIDCTESAAAAGDDYNTSHVLWTEGIASLLAGLLGGVIQTTPYIGHPAYKKMGGRAAYTLATALFIGLAGTLGLFPALYALLPKAAMFTILVFVGLEITAQTFEATEKKHYPALALAMMPALAYLALIILKQINGPTYPIGPENLGKRELILTLLCLANGFIITSLLWASGLSKILDGCLRSAAVYFGIAGVLCFFGVIHSPLFDERMGLPWHILDQIPIDLQDGIAYQTPYHWTGAYAIVVLVLLALSLVDRPAKQPPVSKA